MFRGNEHVLNSRTSTFVRLSNNGSVQGLASVIFLHSYRYQIKRIKKMNTLRCTPIVCVAGLVVFARGQTTALAAQTNTVATSTALVNGLPEIPPTPQPVDLANQLIDPAKKQAVMSAHDAWKKDRGGHEFFSGLTFVGGRPIIMLITDQNESLPAQARRKAAIVGACEFLLDSSAFDTVSICVVEMIRSQNANLRSQTIRTTQVPRYNFEAAARNFGRSSDLRAAIAAAKVDEAAVYQICTQLGIR